MRCFASSTISTAVSGSAPPDIRSSSADARDVVNALLFREILKPLAKALGPVGEIALGTVADDLFVRRRR